MKYFIIIIMLIGCCPNITEPTIDCIYGTVYVAGNKPFTYLALNYNDDYYKITSQHEYIIEELWSMQGQCINTCYWDIILVKI